MKYNEAVDAMYTHVAAAAPVGSVGVWPDVPGTIPENVQWFRPSIHTAMGSQKSLAGEAGARRWMKAGVLIVQCFSPVGDGNKEVGLMVQSFVDYFESLRSSPIWYRNIRAYEVGKDGTSVQCNFMADFEYDDFH